MDMELLRKYSSATLDSCDGKKDCAEEEGISLDDAASAHALNDAALEAAATIQAWAEVNDLEEGENYADVLQDMFFADADFNEDGVLSDDESALAEGKLNAAYDYLVRKGAAEEDAYKLLNDWNPDAAERVHDLVVAKLPDGADADADINSFVFGDEGSEAVMDSVFKKKIIIKGGKKMRVLRKISGPKNMKRVAAAKKNKNKMHSAAALIKRAKSMRIRKARGL